MASQDGNDFGGWIAGLVIELTLCGVMTVQMFMYFSHYRGDHFIVKITARDSFFFLSLRVVRLKNDSSVNPKVGSIFVVQVFYAICISYAMYYYTITAFSLTQAQSSDTRSQWTWQFIAYHEADYITSFTVQTFFVYRIQKMSENLWLSGLVESLVVAQLVCGLLADIKMHINPSMPHFLKLKSHMSVVLAWLSLQAVADVFIAGSMVYLLRQRRTGFKSTETLINRLLFYSVATGLITSVISLVSLAAFKAAGFGFFVDVIAMTLSGLYAVTMLSNLHTRHSLAEKGRVKGTETDISLRLVERFTVGARSH